ncbi:hypothetical protein JANAI62_11680 [Jannaschia pagri]|uniref:Uncharacterized protein n=2 Tax=Jannaschia TaxID=188905 RepID=A0ABQ4NJY2_9RHOB|nr:hypothetical protein [Jannaschia sp. AI_62]GIT90713.1 hypothetical protein JANAI61_11710 [Jannaschia sp. AI_61]GIT94545.1 hypothetical protein JANAI62_11680 [Jannaschia sp. AI_62]
MHLALLTYTNALLVYGTVTYPETGSLAAAAHKVAVSLWWLLPVATPFAAVFAFVGTPLVRSVLTRTAALGPLRSGALATLAFLIPAAALVEAALAYRDGLSVLRYLIQVGGGSVVALLWALCTGRLRLR